MSTSEIPSVDFDSAQRDYWRQVRQSEGFDMENVSIPSNMCGMITGLLPFDCVRYSYPYCVLVNLYAKVGLHRYNMLKGTNFQLDSLVKFNMLQNCVSSFYMTLLAHDPAAPDPLEKTFQVRVDEQKANHLDFECSIARIKDEGITEKSFVPHFHGDAVADGFFKGELPDWPSDDALNDGKRFYLVRLSVSKGLRAQEEKYWREAGVGYGRGKLKKLNLNKRRRPSTSRGSFDGSGILIKDRDLLSLVEALPLQGREKSEVVYISVEVHLLSLCFVVVS
ncbi:hypothetical protein DY000_02023541 [Brassica cretica]|uniref:Uncharacterized protein n=1 Tax=Brassica cretica TaxID=69181 RepID=A0ABQ7EM21_BRACR|nr:hypothetical protein DY000_02023541 [Brassica cretica]